MTYQEEVWRQRKEMVSYSEHQAPVKALRQIAKDTILSPDSPFTEDEQNKLYAIASQIASAFDDRDVILQDSQSQWAFKAGFIMWYIGFLAGFQMGEEKHEEDEPPQVGEAFQEAPF